MRQPNICQPLQNKAAAEISATIYDRRALDSTSALPLLNSLTHLAYLTSVSSRTREIISNDGALERLIQILKNEDYFNLFQPCCKAIVANIIWQLSFQCIVNIGIRGSEIIRQKVVLADIASIIVTILDDFLSTVDNFTLYSSKKIKNESKELTDQESRNQSAITSLENSSSDSLPINGPRTVLIRNADSAQHVSLLDFSDQNASSIPNPREDTNFPSLTQHSVIRGDNENHLITQNYSINEFESVAETTGNIWEQQALLEDEQGFSQYTSIQRKHRYHQEEDVLYCLQLLAYLSKYTYLRHLFQQARDAPNLRVKRCNHSSENDNIRTNVYEEHDIYDNSALNAEPRPIYNIFALVERFTMRIYSPETQYWAGVIMRNACRKDERKGGIRQCANLECGKWEEYNRQFAKCRRCRRTKYCGKACQSKAWPGHRWWCRLRQTN